MSRAEIESKLREIWKKVLRFENGDIKSIADDDNFFELGGTSLMIGMMNIMCEKLLGHKVPMEIYFKNPTLSGMCNALYEEEYQSE